MNVEGWLPGGLYMEPHCPQCQHVLDQDNGHARCPSWRENYRNESSLSRDCHQPLEASKACGAVDYFCQHGHGLRSK
ncbi:zinc ribbon domain-containing protein [Shigella flexneri]